jgi:hypothetical protein
MLAMGVRAGDVSGVEMKYQLRPAIENDRCFLWDLLVATMKGYVTQTWGWDEEYQQRRWEKFPPARYQIMPQQSATVTARCSSP